MTKPAAIPLTSYAPAVVRGDFPALAQSVNGREVCYLDSANSAQKPLYVMAAMDQVMTTHYANVHRAVYSFGAETTVAYEGARAKVARFLNAAHAGDIIFTRNATEAINLVAHSLGAQLQPGDEIILSDLEHHANIVPWYQLVQRKGVVLRVVPITETGALDMAAYQALLSNKTKLVALTHMSNALGTINDATAIAKAAHAVGAYVLFDGSQAVVHQAVDVQAIGADFYVFTGHKLYGPTGIGVLYGRRDLMNSLPPFLGGGEMIDTVAFDAITFKESPYRFEAGTPPIIEAIGLGAAIDYLNVQDLPAVQAHEKALMGAAEECLLAIPGVKLYSRAPARSAIVNFGLEGVHPHDIATILDQMGVAVRAGHHCCQPLMSKLGVSATVRASFGIYNTIEDVERLGEAVQKARKIFT